jgi:hypothetical protein
VFSPHTSWNSVPGGINTWLVSPYGPGKSRPVTLSTSTTFPGGFSHTVTMSGVVVSTEQLQPLLSMPTSLVDKVRIKAHTLPPIPHTGAGQVLTLDTSVPLSQALAMTK